jgi:hypothetical protein
MIFLLSNVLATVEVPLLLQEKFELNTEQLGLQFLGPIIGSLIGEQLGGRTSDLWMNMRAKRTQRKPEPEFRLWLGYFGYACSIVGIIVFLVCTEKSKQGQWNVAPIIGIAIGAAGNQIVTTVLITYAVDCHPEDASSVGVCITFVRQIWGFLGPFWYVPSLCSCCALQLLTVSQVPRDVRECRCGCERWCLRGLDGWSQCSADNRFAVEGTLIPACGEGVGCHSEMALGSMCSSWIEVRL